MFDFLKKNPLKTWKWVAIILACLLCFSTCSNCSHKQNAAWTSHSHQEVIDSLSKENQMYKDSINVLNATIQTQTAYAENVDKEVEYLRGVVKDNNQRTPIIIYKGTNEEE